MSGIPSWGSIMNFVNFFGMSDTVRRAVSSKDGAVWFIREGKSVQVESARLTATACRLDVKITIKTVLLVTDDAAPGKAIVIKAAE